MRPGPKAALIVGCVLGGLLLTWLVFFTACYVARQRTYGSLLPIRRAGSFVDNGIPPLTIRTGEPEWAELHPEVRQLYAAVDEANSPWGTRYFSGRQCREFLLANFDARVLAAYDKLVPGAYKADLFRYCAVYELGGLYLDFTTTPRIPLDELVDRNRDELVLCYAYPDFGFFGPNFQHVNLLNAVFAARPRHPQ